MLVIHKTFMICCIQPATPGYCSFLSITNIQGSNLLLQFEPFAQWIVVLSALCLYPDNTLCSTVMFHSGDR